MDDHGGLRTAAAILVSVGLLLGSLGYWLSAPRRPAGAGTPSSPAPSTLPTTSSPTPAPIPTTVVERGAGTFTDAGTAGPRVGTSGRLLSYRVVVEDGTGQPADAFAASVEATLADPRGWTAGGQWSFQRVAPGTPAEFTVHLATPATTDAICGRYGIRTVGQVSCRAGGTVVINLRRWLLGIPAYARLADYRALVVNHEVGHFLGHKHVRCPAPGRLAPVMQTHYFGMQGCKPNAWPYVDGVFVTGPPAATRHTAGGDNGNGGRAG